MKIKILGRARKNYRKAYRFYRKENTQLARDFEKEISITLGRIRNNPGQFPFIQEEYQKALTTRFPYVIFFKTSEDFVIVTGIFHQKQNADFRGFD